MDKWKELNEKLTNSKQVVNGLLKKTYGQDEVLRLRGKKEGIDLAIQYMFDIEREAEGI